MRFSGWYFFFLVFFCSSAFSQDSIAPSAKPETPVRIGFLREAQFDSLNIREETFDSSLAFFHRTRGFLYDITLERNIFSEEIPIRRQVANFSNDIAFPYKYSDRTIRYYRLN